MSEVKGEYLGKIAQAPAKPSARVLIGTPTTGLVRMEWVLSRYGQVIPVNWSNVQMIEYLSTYVPLNYEVADAQNLICAQVVDGGFEWLLLVEHDTMLPADGFLQFNKYMRERKAPVVSGLYFTRSRPSEPLIFRGRGNSFYTGWEMGDVVECDGIPTGALLIHGDLIRAMWAESAEYVAQGHAVVRRVFNTPREQWYDPEAGVFQSSQGTSDLAWCDRVMANDGYFLRKSGWGAWWEEHKPNPFLCDTGIFCKHIDQDGTVYP